MPDANIKTVTIPLSDIQSIQQDGTILLRYRVKSKDGSRVSHWSKINKIDPQISFSELNGYNKPITAQTPLLSPEVTFAYPPGFGSNYIQSALTRPSVGADTFIYSWSIKDTASNIANYDVYAQWQYLTDSTLFSYEWTTPKYMGTTSSNNFSIQRPYVNYTIPLQLPNYEMVISADSIIFSTTEQHGFVAYQQIFISNAVPTYYNGTYIIDNVSNNTFSIPASSINLPSVNITNISVTNGINSVTFTGTNTYEQNQYIVVSAISGTTIGGVSASLFNQAYQISSANSSTFTAIPMTYSITPTSTSSVARTGTSKGFFRITTAGTVNPLFTKAKAIVTECAFPKISNFSQSNNSQNVILSISESYTDGSGTNPTLFSVWNSPTGTLTPDSYVIPTQTATISGNYVTIQTTGTHGFQIGQQVAIAGVTPTGYNLATRTITDVTSNTLTFYFTSVPAATITVAGTVTSRNYATITGLYAPFTENVSSSHPVEIKMNSLSGYSGSSYSGKIYAIGKNGTQLNIYTSNGILDNQSQSVTNIKL